MKSFQHLEPPLRVYCGTDSLDRLPAELERAKCSRAVVVCGTTLARSDSGLELVIEALGDRYHGLFKGVRAHSPLDTVLGAARYLREQEADAVVAVGGGSAIVTARAAGILLAEGDDIHRLCTNRTPDGRFVSPKLLAPKLAQWVVPTTPTTACVKAGSAVLDPATGQRLALFDPKTRAQAVFVHPRLASTAPESLILSAGMNGVAMACEGLESAASEPIADALLMHALRLFRDHLPRRESADAPVELVLASLLAGKGTDYASGGLASVLGHAIGARSHIENGIANAIILPHTMRFNASASTAGAARVGEVFCCRPGAGADDAISAVSDFVRRLGLPVRLRDVGVSRDDLPEIAAAGMEDWFLSRNPRRVTSVDEIGEVLNAAW